MSTHDPSGSPRPGQQPAGRPYSGGNASSTGRQHDAGGNTYPGGQPYPGPRYGAPQQSGPYGGYQQQGPQQSGPYGGYQQQGPQQSGPYGGHQQVDPGYYGGHQQQRGVHGHPQQGYGYPSTPARAGSQPGVPVGFGEAIKRFYAKYTQFSGRASRSEYWWVALYTFIVVAPLFVLQSTAGTSAFGELNGFGALMTLLMVAFILGNLVPMIAITIRRLHDANLSGWFYLLNFIPYVGGIVMIVLTVLPSKPEGARFDR